MRRVGNGLVMLLVVALIGLVAVLRWTSVLEGDDSSRATTNRPATPAVVAPPAKARPPSCRSGTVALTFDDGPSPTVTPHLLRVLKTLGVPATFFMVGERVAAAPQAAQLVGRSGFAIANHSWAHTAMTTQSSRSVHETLRTTDRALRRLGLRPTRLMRPPYGAMNDRVRRAIRDVGQVPVLWDVDPRDWEGDPSTTIATRILSQLEPHGRNIVLQHDGVGNSPASISALKTVIARARHRGYCFVPLDENGRPGFPTARVWVRATDTVEGRPARATVVLDRPASRETRVVLTTRPGTARAGRDFTAATTTVWVPPGSTRLTVPIATLRDGVDEADERFQVVLQRPRGLVIDTATASVLVRDRNPTPALAAISQRVLEPRRTSKRVLVRFVLSRSSGRPIRVAVRTILGTAGSADLTSTNGLFTIRPGRGVLTVPVVLRPDALDEAVEVFRVRVTAARNARVVRDTAVVRVVSH